MRTLGDYVNYSYDNIGQLKVANGYASNGTVRLHEQFGYAYDQAHNLGRKTNNNFVTRYFVDGINQLTGATNSGKYTVAGTTSGLATNTTVNNSNALLYADATFAQAGITLATGTNTFTARAQDSYGRLDTNTAAAYFALSNSYAYDANGNLISEGSKGFTYDDENQLTRITATNSWKSEFTYDGKMRRRVRKEYVWRDGAWALTETINYIYDGNLVLQERFFADSYQIQQVTYTRGMDLSGTLQGAGGIGGLLAYTRGVGSVSEHSYYHADANGNISAMVSTQQVVVAKYVYDPFGNTLSASGPMADLNFYRFSSKEVHEPSGLLHYPYRYYNSVLQRWATTDPIMELGAATLRAEAIINPGDRNLYVFVINNPLNMVDPFGLEGYGTGFAEYQQCIADCQKLALPCKIAAGIAGGVAGAAAAAGCMLACPGPLGALCARPCATLGVAVGVVVTQTLMGVCDNIVADCKEACKKKCKY